MVELLIRNAKAFLPDGPRTVDVVVRDGAIAALGDSAASGTDAVDAAGLWLLPGAVDPHVHFGMPLRDGLASRGWRDSSTAALLGGTTTVVDFANPERGEPLADALGRWRAAAAGDCLCDHAFHVTVCDAAPERLDEIAGLAAEGCPTFKGFLAYKDRLMLEPEAMGRLMERVKAAGGRLLVHAEDGEWNDRVAAELRAAGRTQVRHHPDAHPADSEVEAVATLMELVAKTGCPTTVVHLSTAGGLARIDAARAAGLPVTAEVCVQHLFRTAELYDGDEATALAAVMSPPLRPASDAAALRAGLAEGRLDWVATDHCEFATTAKRTAAAEGFDRIPNGGSGVGERLIVLYTLGVCEGLISPERWGELCCTAPARAMGLKDKGEIRVGADADLVLFDPEARGTVLPFNAENSLWTGEGWRGAVRDVWLRGRHVVIDGQLTPDPVPGQEVPRSYA